MVNIISISNFALFKWFLLPLHIHRLFDFQLVSRAGWADDSAHAHAVTSTQTVFPAQIRVEVTSLLIAFHAVDGWITVSGRRQRGVTRQKKDPATRTSMQTVSWTFKACTHMHSLAWMPANKDCYQLISGSSCRGQAYWHCNDSFLVSLAPSVDQPCHSDSIINTQTLG